MQWSSFKCKSIKFDLMKIISDKVHDGVRIVTAATEGVCSVQINLALQGDVILDAMFYGGCNGNLQGICALSRGARISDVKERLKGIRCGNKATSCPDQFAQMLEALM